MTSFGSFEVEVVDCVADYLTVLQRVFDFPMLKAFLSRSDVSIVFDSMHAVTGPYAYRILCDVSGTLQALAALRIVCSTSSIPFPVSTQLPCSNAVFVQ